jgi:hypothetical protein
VRDSDEAKGRIILQDIELAMRDAPEHKAAVAAGVDDAQQAILEGPEPSSYSGFRRRRGSGSQRMRNGAAKPPYAEYTWSTAKWAALGDGYRHRDA